MRKLSLVGLSLTIITSPLVAQQFRSHPPLRTISAAPTRSLPKGPTYFVDAQHGDNKSDGSKSAPWKTLAHAVGQLKAGDTLYLRGGVYYENVAIRLGGRKDAPVTIAVFPGEQAILDGGVREFFETPEKMWQPYPTGGPGEYRSTRCYPNLRNVVGSFGDSMVGLHTYYHALDLRADVEHVELAADKSDIKPIYCGPGLWYNRDAGYLHAKFGHTHIADFDNYRGEQDPRKLPLVIAPFRSVPLHLDRAEHVVIRDLIIRGGGHNTVLLDQCSDVMLDNVTIWCGTYGLRVIGTQRLKLYRCGVYGNAPPWITRFEASLKSRPGSTRRDITRQNTHALLVAQGNGEYDVYAYPLNDDWEIAYCEFTDAGADGLYLGGVNMKFHHNLVDHMRDDGVYLSPMYPRHFYLRGGARLDIYQNVFSRAMTMFAFGGTEDTRDTVYFCRNIVDLRAPGLFARPTTKAGRVKPYMGHLMGDHGSPPWSAMNSYHNTIIAGSPSRSAHMNLLTGATKDRSRRSFNNILIHGSVLPAFAAGDAAFAIGDGNIYWQPGLDPKRAASYFAAYRNGPAFLKSKQAYAPGQEAGSMAIDPRFVKCDMDCKIVNDYRLQPGSPAIDAGVAIPKDWPDPLRALDKGRPDIGAVPLGAPMLKVGRAAAP